MSRNASGNNFKIQTDLVEFLRGVVVSYDPGTEENDEGNSGSGGSEGGSEDDEGSEGGDGSGASGSGGNTGIKDQEKKKLSDEAARHRNAAKAEKERADKAEAELRTLTDKDKTDLEKTQRDLTEANAKVEKLAGQLENQAVKLAFYESGAAALFKNPTQARKLLDLSDLKADEDGNMDAKAIKAKAEALLKESPYLAADGSSDDGGSAPGGSPNNGRRRNGKEADQAKLAKKFPALSGRV